MKKIVYLIGVFAFIFCHISCKTTTNANNSIDTSNPLANTFILKTTSEAFFSGEQMMSQIKRYAGIPDGEELIDLTLRRLENTEKTAQDTTSDLYVLNARTKDGRSSIAHIFRADSTKSRLIDEGKICVCTSTNCTQGCDAQILYEGSCSCSPCPSGCKKESKVID